MSVVGGWYESANNPQQTQAPASQVGVGGLQSVQAMPGVPIQALAGQGGPAAPMRHKRQVLQMQMSQTQSSQLNSHLQHNSHMTSSMPGLSLTTGMPQQQQQQQQHNLVPQQIIQQPPVLIPTNHTTTNANTNANMPWHHGSISRERAEQLLLGITDPAVANMPGGGDGLFLVRESTNFPGDHALCVRWRGRVEHYRIKWVVPPGAGGGPGDLRLTIDDEEFFENMSDLIDHYLLDADGLCTQLVTCLPVQVAPPIVDRTQAFKDGGWLIDESQLEMGELIGKGESGRVMAAVLAGVGKVAVKILQDCRTQDTFLAEASLMTSLKHENLVRLLGLVFGRSKVCLVTEYMARGSLVDYLRSRGRHHVAPAHQIHFAYDTCLGMEYLERRGVVHRDLAARNVLLSADGRAKVADFGLARRTNTHTAVGEDAAKLPIKWTAPEALKYNQFSNKSDMWSFGILIWEIYSFGRVPYPRIPLSDVVRYVERGGRLEAPAGCPSDVYDLMQRAWAADPSQRPTFAHAAVTIKLIKDKTPQTQPPMQGLLNQPEPT